MLYLSGALCDVMRAVGRAARKTLRLIRRSLEAIVAACLYVDGIVNWNVQLCEVCRRIM